MDRKKSKLNTVNVQFNAIIDETTVLKENIEQLIDQVYSCVQNVKECPQDIGQKSTDIVKYELDVLTKLVDMNSMVENILDLNRLNLINKWKIPDKKFTAVTAFDSRLRNLVTETNTQFNGFQLPVSQNAETQSANDEHEHLGHQNEIPHFSPYVPHQSEIHSVPAAEESLNSQFSHSRTIDNTSDNTQIGTNISHLSNTEEIISNVQFPQYSNSTNEEGIQCVDYIVRQQLKLLGSQLGFNNTSFSNMEDHYKKSSGVPVDISMSHSYVSSDAQQIPERLERDTHEVANTQMLNIDSTLAIPNEIKQGFSNVEHLSGTCDTKINNSVIEFCMDNPTEQNHSLLNGFHSSYEISDSGESSSSYHTACNLGEATALKKLNNYAVRHKEETILVPVDLPHIPDISLKPTKKENIPEYITEDTVLPKKTSKSKKKSKPGTEKDISHDLKSKQTPKVGDQCVFSHIESPSEFYLHIVDEETSSIDKIAEQIAAHFNGTSSEYKTKEEASKYLGQYCCASMADEWFRVSIHDWKLNAQEDVLIQLVDFGDLKITSYRNLRNLTKDLTELPMLAVRCHLPLMYPPGSTNLDRLSEWPLESTEALYNLSGALESTRPIEFELVYAEKDQNSVAVDLRNPVEINNDDTVGQVLLNLGYAVQLVDVVDEDDYEALQDIQALESANNINEAVMGYDPRDEARICRFAKPDGTCFKGKHCKLEHTFLPKDGFTTDTEIVFREAFDELCLPLPKETVNLLITGYIDPCTFFAHVVRDPHRESHYYIDKNLFELEKVLNNEKMVRSYESFKISPAIGEMVVAKDWTKKWRRAVVRDVKYANNGGPLSAQVFTLDFGETLTIDINHVKKIKPQFLQLPFQAIKCYISDYKASTKCNPKNAKDYFEKNLYFHNFFADVMSHFLPLKIKLTSMTGCNIGQRLEDENFAEKLICDNNPSEECSFDLY